MPERVSEGKHDSRFCSFNLHRTTLTKLAGCTKLRGFERRPFVGKFNDVLLIFTNIVDQFTVTLFKITVNLFHKWRLVNIGLTTISIIT